MKLGGDRAVLVLHSANQLEWQTPFDYVIHQGGQFQLSTQLHATQQMTQYLTTRQCRWQFLLNSFGFSKEATNMHCGQCDNCCK